MSEPSPLPTPPPVPPVLGEARIEPAEGGPRPVAGWRLAIALLLLTGYVLLPAFLGFNREDHDDAVLPPNTSSVLVLCAFELSLFGLAFGAATGLARFRREDLLLRWPRHGWIWPRAVAWSVLLRLGVGGLLAGSLALTQVVRGEPLKNLDNLRPKVEAMVDVSALQDPVYLVLMLTVVSFILAGLREELWRIGMVCLLGRLAPAWFGGKAGPWLALLPVAILFGLGHTAQGWAGVAATTALGLGLGAILLFHRSLWDAVLAHGFFNATTFALLPWLAHLIPQATNSH